MRLFQSTPPSVVIGDVILCTRHVQREPCRTCPYCALQLVSEAMVEANLPEAPNSTTVREIWRASQCVLSVQSRKHHGRLFRIFAPAAWLQGTGAPQQEAFQQTSRHYL